MKHDGQSFAFRFRHRAIILLPALFFPILCSQAALEFRRGEEGQSAYYSRSFEDPNNWTANRAGGASNYSEAIVDSGSWIGDYYSGSSTTAKETLASVDLSGVILHEIYIGPNSAYNGNDAVGENGNDGFCELNSDIQTYRWFVGYYGKTNPTNYVNTALGIKGTGTITIDNSYATGTLIEKPALQTTYAGNDFTVDVDLELMCVKNTSGEDITNTFDLNSTYNTYFKQGNTITLTNSKTPKGSAAASKITEFTIQVAINSEEATGKVYIGSQIIAGAYLHLRSTGAWSTNPAEYGAKIQLCGNVTNFYQTLGLWRKIRVEFNMQDGALVLPEGGIVHFGYSNTLDLLGENQVSRTEFRFTNDGTATHAINLNGHSMGVYADTPSLQISSMNFLKNTATTTGGISLTIDFGDNATDQVFAFGSASSTLDGSDEPSILIKNFKEGDRFITEFALGEEWIGNAEDNGFITFEGYEDGFYIVASQIDDISDVYYGMYEYTLSPVPEPACIAGIFGALALAFAARSRKR